MIKILFLAANPSDMTRLQLGQECRSIDQALQQAAFREQFALEDHWAVRVGDLQKLLLRHKPTIVHFSGHGTPANEIILEDENGNSKAIPEQVLRQLFHLFKDHVRCVVLNACYSERQAAAIAEEIGCVIGMPDTINDKAAIAFATAFYQALGFGQDLKRAFELGCLEIDLENLGEENKPKLWTATHNPETIQLVGAGRSFSFLNLFSFLNWQWWLALLLIASSGVAFLLFGNLPFLTSSESMGTATEAPATIPFTPAVATADNRQLTVSATASPVPTFELPEAVPPVTTTIALATMTACFPENNAPYSQVSRQFATLAPPLSIITLTVPADDEAAMAAATAAGADLIIWGGCEKTEQRAAVQVDFLQMRGSPDVYEPTALQMTEMTNYQEELLVYGASHYVYRNYTTAANAFATLAKLTHTPETGAALYLLLGNSLLYSQRYTEAATAYRQAVALQPNWAVAHYNLGVAYMNEEWQAHQFETALTIFSKTLELDPNFALVHLARGQMWTWLGDLILSDVHSLPYYQQAERACERAVESSLSLIRQQAQLCLLQIQRARYDLGLLSDLPDVEQLDLERMATPYWSAPLITQAMLSYTFWNMSQDPIAQRRAERYLLRAIESSLDDVQTEPARENFLRVVRDLERLRAAATMK